MGGWPDPTSWGPHGTVTWISQKRDVHHSTRLGPSGLQSYFGVQGPHHNTSSIPLGGKGGAPGQSRAEGGPGRPGHVTRGWSQHGATPCGDLDHPWPGKKEEQTLRGLSQRWWFHFFPLSKSQGVWGGHLRHLPAPGLTGVHPKMPGEPPACPSQGHPHPQSGEMGLERDSQGLGDPKTSAHTAGTDPELPGEHGHRSHLPLPHAPTYTGTLCPCRVWQRRQCRVGGESPGMLIVPKHAGPPSD